MPALYGSVTPSAAAVATAASAALPPLRSTSRPTALASASTEATAPPCPVDVDGAGGAGRAADAGEETETAATIKDAVRARLRPVCAERGMTWTMKASRAGGRAESPHRSPGPLRRQWVSGPATEAVIRV